MNLVKLENITKMLKSQVANGEVKGASAYVLRGGHPIYRANVGMADEARGIKWENDTIVRLYSATKNITAAAVMISVSSVFFLNNLLCVSEMAAVCQFFLTAPPRSS